MRLRIYLLKNHLSIEKFSLMMGYTAQYLGALLNGRLKCPERVCLLIEHLTKGQVTAKEMKEDMEEERKKFLQKKLVE